MGTLTNSQLGPLCIVYISLNVRLAQFSLKARLAFGRGEITNSIESEEGKKLSNDNVLFWQFCVYGAFFEAKPEVMLR